MRANLIVVMFLLRLAATQPFRTGFCQAVIREAVRPALKEAEISLCDIEMGSMPFRYSEGIGSAAHIAQSECPEDTLLPRPFDPNTSPIYDPDRTSSS